MMNRALYPLGLFLAVAAGVGLSNDLAERAERQRIEAQQARSITEDFVIHRITVPHHATKSTPIITMTYHVSEPLNAGFGASVIAADGSIHCANTSGKAGGIQIPVTLNPVLRITMSRITGPCELPPGRYTLAIRFNVRIAGVLKSISAISDPFTVSDD